MAGKLLSRPLLFIIASAVQQTSQAIVIGQSVLLLNKANFLDDEITGNHIFHALTIFSILHQFRS